MIKQMNPKLPTLQHNPYRIIGNYLIDADDNNSFLARRVVGSRLCHS